MENESLDMNRDLMLDGNSIAGLLYDIFATEMTTTPAECNNCGSIAPMGALLAFTQAPGTILRCPACESIVLRIVETPTAIYIDARGAAYLRIQRTVS